MNRIFLNLKNKYIPQNKIKFWNFKSHQAERTGNMEDKSERIFWRNYQNLKHPEEEDGAARFEATQVGLTG